jgi:hypothetical protein
LKIVTELYISKLQNFFLKSKFLKAYLVSLNQKRTKMRFLKIKKGLI